jgi:hypothetical protein
MRKKADCGIVQFIKDNPPPKKDDWMDSGRQWLDNFLAAHLQYKPMTEPQRRYMEAQLKANPKLARAVRRLVLQSQQTEGDKKTNG